MRKPITSRRAPKLRLVGSASESTRHRTVFEMAHVPYIVEVWTHEEFHKLAAWERPESKNFGCLPGIGYVCLRHPFNENEVEDAGDVSNQYLAELQLMAGEA